MGNILTFGQDANRNGHNSPNQRRDTGGNILLLLRGMIAFNNTHIIPVTERPGGVKLGSAMGVRAAQKVMAMVMAIITPKTAKVIHLNSSATAPPAAKAEPAGRSVAIKKARIHIIFVILCSQSVRVIDDCLGHGIKLAVCFSRINKGSCPGYYKL